MWAYFDTSALVKRYIDEPGRREVLRLLRRHACVTSVLLPVELRSALRRRVAEGTLDAIHVASAQLFANRVTAPELIFVSAGARQTAAAAAVRMAIRHIGS